MQKYQFFYLHIGLIPQVLLGRSHVMLLELCLCVVSFKTCFFSCVSSRVTKFENFDAGTLAFFGMYC